MGRSRLKTAATTTPGLDAEVLLRYALGIDRTQLFTRLREPIASESAAVYVDLLEERVRDVPIAYLVGEREFLGLSFEVGPGVLVPRPETEILVEWAIAWLHDRELPTVVDVGTGSGAIAISIAATIRPDWQGRILAADISPDAALVAARNRLRLDLDHRVSLILGSLTSWLRGPVDLILANLPYLRPDQIAQNPALAAEPRLALDGGRDGLDLIRDLINDGPRVVAPGGALGLEIDPSQMDDVLSMARQAFPDSEIRVLRDLAGLDRHVVVQSTGCRSGS